jgi:hypothetical protein
VSEEISQFESFDSFFSFVAKRENGKKINSDLGIILFT